jgi:SH3 domain-containing YSC84-like protein 1
MKLNTPLPQSLPKECAKAAKICTSTLPCLGLPTYGYFSTIIRWSRKQRFGWSKRHPFVRRTHPHLVRKVVPRSVLDNAKGFAIFTVFKAGFLFSARAGSGIVIAKLYDGSEYEGNLYMSLLCIFFCSVVRTECYRNCGRRIWWTSWC